MINSKLKGDRRNEDSKTLTLKDGRIVRRESYVTAKTLDLKESISKTIQEEDVSDALFRMEDGVLKGLTMVDVFVREDFV